ncbi:MAG: hypothetical protein U1E28_07920 [Beijerinckiaceae bacterium]
MTSATPAIQPRSDVMRRCAIVIGALAVFALGRMAPLPGVDMDAARATSARLGLPGDLFTIFSIGVTPIVSSALLLELVQLVFPSLRALCATSSRAATRLRRIWLVMSLVFAAMQAHGIAGGMLGLDGLVPETDGFVWTIVVTIVGATALLFWLSAFVSAAGYGDGLWLLYAAAYVGGLVRLFSSPLEQLGIGAGGESEMSAVLVALAIAVVALAALFLRTNQGTARERVETFVWPAMIGFYGAGMLVNVLRFFLDAPAAYGPVHMGLVFLLILAVAFLREGSTQVRMGAPRVLLLVVAETAICVIVGVAARQAALPFGLEAPGLVATIAAIAGLASSMRDSLRKPATTP